MGDGDGRRPEPGDRARWTPRVPDGDPRHPDASEAAAAVWDGSVWGRLGRADLAWQLWSSVDDPALAPWVAAERGRVLRELGLHDAARAIEQEGLAGTRDVTDAVMLRISLAADAIGVTDADSEERLERADRELTAAVALLDELPPGPRTSRQRLRARWVGVEIALARGTRADATGLPWPGEDGPVYPIEHDDGTDFHRAKGLLFAGIVRRDRSLLVRAAELAPPALLWAVELARLDAGDARAAERAVTAWERVVPPPELADEVAATPTARRLRAAA